MDGKRSVLILEAIRLVTELRPPVLIWENVKGAFSSNSGADFWAILQAFANIGGYRLEWQLLNTKWFLPQNRERIYLVGHLAGSERSFGNVFPISEDNCFSYERRKDQEKVHILAQTLTAGDFKSQRGNFLQIGAIRGRNPENPKSRESGLATKQMLEINKEGVSNTLTSVQKDNVVIQLNQSKESGGVQPYQQNRIYAAEGLSPTLDQSAGRWSVGTLRTHNDGKGFRKVSDDNSPTIPARAREDGSGQPVIQNDNSIRRLTEIECERLQGFPDDWTKYGNYDGTIKEIPKTQRYKMLGNAVTVKVVEEIGKRLLQ